MSHTLEARATATPAVIPGDPPASGGTSAPVAAFREIVAAHGERTRRLRDTVSSLFVENRDLSDYAADGGPLPDLVLVGDNPGRKEPGTGEINYPAIARALANDPKILLLDEPFGALDNQTRALMQEMLLGIWERERKTVLFVTHDIGVAVEISDRIAVMYAGQIIEEGTTHEVINDPRHPYTRGLLAANLHDVKKGERLDAIPGVPPALEAKPAACSFAQRCPHTMPRCRAALPPMVVLGERRRVACVLEEERGASPPLPPAQGVLTP